MPNRINYDLEMMKILSDLEAAGEKPALLLHACCAPCSSATLERLASHFAVTILYYNPNIYPPAEYHRREQELERFVRDAGYAPEIAVVELPYDPREFYEAIRGLEEEPERGARCTVCYRLRLEAAARYAAAHHFGWFTTTLSISPVKDPVRLNTLGATLAAQYGLQYLPSEFRKRDGYKRSLALSQEYGLYRQDYCGCQFSKAERGV
ncbi:MAG: epoxyqueuosine reductase QueH [Gemmiger sp.]|nr:epoxyqueuosine reductase QueH [Gemmiger sp.]